MRNDSTQTRSSIDGISIIAVILAMVIAIVALAGCSQTSSNSGVSGAPAGQAAENEGDAERRAANEATAIEYMHAFYDDWTFANGKAEYSTEAFNRRSLPYIEEGSALYEELSKDNSFGLGSESRFARSAALHAFEVKAMTANDDVCVVEVTSCGTQNDVTQELYDDMKNRAETTTWTLVFDEDGKICSMDKGDVSGKYARNGEQGDDVYLGVNRAVSFYVEMEANYDWLGPTSFTWKAFDASSEPVERVAWLAFYYLYRHDSASTESCKTPASEIGADLPSWAEYDVRIKQETLENTIEHLYGVRVDLTTLSAAGQSVSPHYHDGYVYFYITNGAGFLAGAALADSITANGDGTYNVKCGVYSNGTGNMFDPENDSVYSSTPEELMQRYSDVTRVADATATVRLEDDGHFTLQEFICTDQGGLGASKVTALFESGYGDVKVRLTPGFGFIDQPSSTCNWDLALTAVTLSGLVYSSESAADTLEELGYDEAQYSYRDELMHTTSCFGYRNERGKNIFAIVVRGTRGGTGRDVDLTTDLLDGGTAMFDATRGYVMEDFEDFAESATGKPIEQLKQEENYFFITGHSLGAAVANCLSVDGEIMELAADDKEKIYTYTFESPHTCINLWWMDPSSMSNAFNFKDNDDAVTHLPPYAGSATYGIDVPFDVNQLDNGAFMALFPNVKGGSVTEAPKEENYGSGIAGQTLGHHDRGLNLTLIVQEGIISGVWQNVDDVLA